jgi:hypothetical protein
VLYEIVKYALLGVIFPQLAGRPRILASYEWMVLTYAAVGTLQPLAIEHRKVPSTVGPQMAHEATTEGKAVYVEP